MTMFKEIVQQEIETPEELDAHMHGREEAAEATGLASINLRRRTFEGLLLVLLVTGGYFSYHFWQKGRDKELKGKAPQEAPSAAAAGAIPADIVTVEEEELKRVTISPVGLRSIDVEQETTGKVAFNEDRMTPVFTPYAGRVVEVLVNKGAMVQAGQPLLVVESPEYVTAQNELAAARSEVDKSKIAVDAAARVVDRMRTLLAREAVAAKDLQMAEVDLARAQEEFRRDQAAVAVARNRLELFGKDGREIEQLEGRVAEKIDRRVVIRAPITGTIIERKVGPGEYIKPDLPDPLFMLTDLSTLWVMADVYESFLPHIRVGSPVRISTAAYPDRAFPARVSFINPTVDPATRTVHVRCVVPNPGGALKPEMFAKIKIGAAVPSALPAIPSGAVISQNNASYVLVEEAHGRFRRREIKPNREENGFTIVGSGLQPGERVVTSGVLLLNSMVGKPQGKAAEKSE